MKKNEILSPLNTFLQRIAYLQGTLLHFEVALKSYSKNYNNKATINGHILGYRLIIGDLTGPSDNGWKITFPTDATHSVKLDELDNEISGFIERETNYSLSQALESFSTFLKDILADYLEQNVKDAIKYKVILENDSTKNINWKSKIREFNPWANNDKLFKLLRKISTDFKNSELNNNSSINLKDWLKSYSFFRHKVIHSIGSFSTTDSDYENLNDNNIKYLKRFFHFKEKNGKLFFEINRQESYRNFELLAEYAFLIFKELSIELNQDWTIFDNTTKTD